MEDFGALVRYLASKPQAVRLLVEAYRYEKVMGKPPYTRQLLAMATRSFDRNYAERLLQEMAALGLLKRYWDYEKVGRARIPVVRNKPTELAIKLLKLLGELGDGDGRLEVRA